MSNQNERRRIIPASKRILTPLEQDGLKTQLVESKPIKADRDHYQPELENQTDPFVNGTQNRYKRELQRNSARPLSEIPKGERVRMESDFKKLGESLSSKMIPRSATTLRGKDGYEFRKAVNEMARTEYGSEFQVAAAKYKNLARELYPDDPDKANLESIRPK